MPYFQTAHSGVVLGLNNRIVAQDTHTHTDILYIHIYILNTKIYIYIGIIMVASMSIEVDDIYHRGM